MDPPLYILISKFNNTMTVSETLYAKAFTELERSVYTALKTYANVHRGTGYNSMVTTALYERAREIVLEFLELDKNKYVVVFCSPLRLKFFKKKLKAAMFHILSSKDIGLPLGIRAIAIKRKILRKSVLFHTGGGIIKHVTSNSVVWADIPEKFEAGTPNIINIIAFAKALKLIMHFGNIFITEQANKAITLKKILYQDDFLGYSGKELLLELRNALIGRDILVPTVDGERSFINLDNGASTPTFLPIWDTFCQTWRQPENLRQEIIKEVKKICAEFLNAPLREYDIIFTSNTTEAINIVAQNLACASFKGIKPVVVNTILEHHSNELPWRYISSASLIRLSVDNEGFIDLNELENLMREYNQNHKHGRKRIQIVAVSGASNVLGTFSDLQAIARLTHKYGAYILVDGAQMISHRVVNVAEIDIDYLAFSGHKAYAPFGSGVLVSKKGYLEFNTVELNKIKLSGEENVVGIAAMGKAILLLQRIGMNVIEDHEKELTKRVIRGLNKIKAVEIFGVQNLNSPRFYRRGSIISFSLKQVPHNLAAKELAEYGGIGARNGCFCSHLLIQQILKLIPIRVHFARILSMVIPKQTSFFLPGLLRISFGIENDESDVDYFIQIIEKITRKSRSRINRLLAYTHNGTTSLPQTRTQEKIRDFVKSSINNVFNIKMN